MKDIKDHISPSGSPPPCLRVAKRSQRAARNVISAVVAILPKSENSLLEDGNYREVVQT